ncbi:MULTISPECIES: PadR family transcriptional regulator [unclassified Streptomyces]|uniref:PadR family transcriptional regulator n=1 Tax=unclassified Streptomyces TaxID=2593676 RepID=UPI00340A3D22
MPSIRLTRTTLEVLKVLVASKPDDPAWGLKICLEAQLGSGTVYPILERLERNGWITVTEESGPHPGRPARRYYTLTSAGAQFTREAFAARSIALRPAFGEGNSL